MKNEIDAKGLPIKLRLIYPNQMVPSRWYRVQNAYYMLTDQPVELGRFKAVVVDEGAVRVALWEKAQRLSFDELMPKDFGIRIVHG